MSNAPPVASPSNQAFALVGWVVLAFAAAAIGAVASAGGGSFYAELVRPTWAPPGGLFGPIWTTLYALMGLSAWLVWRARGIAGARVSLVLFVVQLAFNALWSWIFFVWRQGGLAFVEALLLWCLIVGTVIGFWRIKVLAGVLLLPYLAWVTYAAALTFAVWRLNPQLLK